MSLTANFLESIAQNYGISGKFSNNSDYSINNQSSPVNSMKSQPVQPPNTPVILPAEPISQFQNMKLEEKEDPLANQLLEKYKVLYKIYEQSLDYKKEINKKLDEMENLGKSRSTEYTLKLRELDAENKTTNYVSDQLEDVFTQIKACGYTLKLDFTKGTHILIKI